MTIFGRLLILIALLSSAGPCLTQTLRPEASKPTATRSVQPDDAARPLAGMLRDAAAWRAYRTRFISEQGRVIDTANGGISHSEGQGYGMLLAVAAGDHETFDLLWGWTRANLMVRDDALLAWRWEPDKRPAVADMNDAADGDILVAWALTEAAEAWHDTAYRVAARRVAVDIGQKLVIPRSPHGAILLPGVAGFAREDRADGPLVNLSYWVFPAFARLPLVAPDIDWAGLSRNGLELVKQVRFGPARVPTDWVSLHDDLPRPADGFAKQFSYNAIRIPLYIAWAGLGQREIYAPFLLVWRAPRGGGLPIIDAVTGQPADWFGDKGYSAIRALAACAADRTPFTVRDKAVHFDESYYAVTLDLLALVAGHMRYASCLDP